jgi:hypothetical protein
LLTHSIRINSLQFPSKYLQLQHLQVVAKHVSQLSPRLDPTNQHKRPAGEFLFNWQLDTQELQAFSLFVQS